MTITLHDVAVAAGSTTAILAAFAGVWKVVAKVYAFVVGEIVDPIRANRITLKEQGEAIREIRHQVLPNGGKSLHDEIRKAGGKIDAVESGMAIMLARQLANLKFNPLPLVWTDKDGQVIAVSQGYIELTGLDSHAARNEGWRQIVHPDDRDRVVERWHECLEDGHHDTFRFRVVRRGSTTAVWVETDIETVRLRDTSLVGFTAKMTRVIDPKPAIADAPAMP